MMIFWIVAVLLAAAALAFVLIPLTAGRADPQARRIRRQLDSLDQALADGHIDSATYETRHAALQAELESTGAPPGTGTRMPPSAIALVIVVPLAAILVYLLTGEPRALTGDTSATAPRTAAPQRSDGAGEQAPELAQAISTLAARLKENPADVDGWFLLGQSYMTVGNTEGARDAFARAYELAPNEPAVIEMYATAMAFAAGNTTVPEEARALFRQALQHNPGSQRPLYFMGVAEFQDGNYRTALEYWEPLYAQLDADSPAAGQLLQDMNAARAQLGLAAMEVDDAAPVAAARAPENAPPTTASTAGPALTVRVTLDEGLRNRVSASDTLFIFARPAQGPRMPLAIHRIPAGSLPVTVRLDESMAMTPEMTLSSFPEVVVGARISRSGNAMPQPGDLEVISQPVANDHAQPIALKIDRVL